MINTGNEKKLISDIQKVQMKLRECLKTATTDGLVACMALTQTSIEIYISKCLDGDKEKYLDLVKQTYEIYEESEKESP